VAEIAAEKKVAQRHAFLKLESVFLQKVPQPSFRPNVGPHKKFDFLFNVVLQCYLNVSLENKIIKAVLSKYLKLVKATIKDIV
jgi:hypothetical protein